MHDTTMQTPFFCPKERCSQAEPNTQRKIEHPKNTQNPFLSPRFPISNVNHALHRSFVEFRSGARNCVSGQSKVPRLYRMSLAFLLPSVSQCSQTNNVETDGNIAMNGRRETVNFYSVWPPYRFRFRRRIFFEGFTSVSLAQSTLWLRKL